MAGSCPEMTRMFILRGDEASEATFLLSALPKHVESSFGVRTDSCWATTSPGNANRSSDNRKLIRDLGTDHLPGHAPCSLRRCLSEYGSHFLAPDPATSVPEQVPKGSAFDLTVSEESGPWVETRPHGLRGGLNRNAPPPGARRRAAALPLLVHPLVAKIPRSRRWRVTHRVRLGWARAQLSQRRCNLHREDRSAERIRERPTLQPAGAPLARDRVERRDREGLAG